MVRIEIEAALARNVRVIPTLVENALMPRWQDLPESLGSLARHNAFIIRHESFRYDAERLITSIEGVIGARKSDTPHPPLKSSVTQQRRWRLELVAKERNKTTFLLSADRDTHMITIWLSWAIGAEWIDVDGKRVAKSPLGEGDPIPVPDLTAELGFLVTIAVTRKLKMTDVRSLTVKLGDQSLTYHV
jgi:hypothetical protein